MVGFMTTIAQHAERARVLLMVKQPDAIQTGEISRTTITGGGPSDPTGGASTTATYGADMAVFEIDERRIDGTNIKAGDFRVIIWPIGIEITLADRVICDRGELTIAKLGRVASGGETALYDMVCRG